MSSIALEPQRRFNDNGGVVEVEDVQHIPQSLMYLLSTYCVLDMHLSPGIRVVRR